jgi:hypothetical protein
VAAGDVGEGTLPDVMTHQFVYAVVMDGPRKSIHAIRVIDSILELPQIDEITAKMRERMLSRHGEQFADVVVIQGNSKETLRLFGDSYAVSRVRAAMFHAAIRWQPIELT